MRTRSNHDCHPSEDARPANGRLLYGSLRSVGRQLMDLQINGKTVEVSVKSDVAVAKRVAAHIERRVLEDDWTPYITKQDAVNAWKKLGGIRLKVLLAYDLA